ncbi:hypothetical protein Pla123a_32790 [Posidoniimonas polymericola]|uniref:Uncharacterized protein n=1 Tax=Posidoniimonas polymericola TaxID=2528002 RepID=A0A5C5YFF6_9BACT|nr:hypothetical protein [Posidoniimonas polymericola]TWT74456.1 hypothetical protein Pla123a_32790 [Posidoniimonas polymericola]
MNLDQFVATAIGQDNSGELAPDATAAQRLLIDFNRSIDQLVDRHGLEAIGKTLWFAYGCVGDVAHDALQPAGESGYGDFYASLIDLYELGFANYCEDAAHHSHRAANSFATACYMLWDMDGGLEHLTLHARPELFPYAEVLFDFGLSHRHAAVQESFLHGLGHLHGQKTSFVEDKISQFLLRTDTTRELRQYAQECSTGLIL